jgi:hypothetical protein
MKWHPLVKHENPKENMTFIADPSPKAKTDKDYAILFYKPWKAQTPCDRDGMVHKPLVFAVLVILLQSRREKYESTERCT